MPIWLILLIAVPILLGVGAWIAGSRLPSGHVVARRRTVAQPPEVVWHTITDFAQVPGWHPGVKSVERLPDRDGNALWLETYQGNHKMTLEVKESTPPHRLVREIADKGGPFSGRWEFAIAPAPGGSEVAITERGQIPNPLVRLMFRNFMDPALYLQQYLDALAAKLGTPEPINQ